MSVQDGPNNLASLHLRTLIVEDNPSDAELMTMRLKNDGLNLDWQRVETEKDFLAALNPELDLILSDWTLPQFSGIRALQLLREHDLDTPFIIVSGNIGEEAAVDALRQGANDYLLKDRPERLNQAILNALKQKSLHDEQKKSAELICASEAELKKAQSFAHIGSWIWNIKTNQLTWSDEMYHLFGLQKDTFSGALEDVIAKAIHPDDRLRVEQSNQNVAENGLAIPIDYRIILPDGTIRQVWAEAGELNRDENGKPTILRGIVQDITERKQREEEVNQRNEEIKLLYEAGRQLSQSLDIQNIYKTFYELISKILKFDTLYISRFDPQTELISAEFGVTDGKFIDVNRFPSIALEPEGHGIQSQVIRSGESRIIQDYQAELKNTNTNYYFDDNGQEVELTVSEDDVVTRSALLIPIFFKNQVSGVVQFQNSRKYSYSDQDLHIAESLVSQIAVARNNAFLYQQAQNEISERKQAEAILNKHMQRQEKIAALGRALAATLDIDRIFQVAEEYLKGMIDCPNLGIAFFDQEAKTLTAAFLSADDENIDIKQLPPLPYSPQNAANGRSLAIASQTPVIVNDLETRRKDSGTALLGSDREPQSAVYIPMLINNEVVGLIDLQSYAKDAYQSEDAEWLSVVANQIGLTIQNARLFAQAHQRLAEMEAFHTIDSAVTAQLSQNKAFDILLEQTSLLLHVDAADILLYNTETQTLSFTAGRGFQSRIAEKTVLKLGEGLAGQAALEKRTVQILNLSSDSSNFAQREAWSSEDFNAYVGVPLIADEKIIGVLEIFNRTPLSPNPDWHRFLELLAGQAAIAVDKLGLYQNIERANAELLQAYDATIEGWSQAMDMRDKETEGHTRRVTDMSMKLAQALGVKEEERVHIYRGALLHDMGKLGVPDQILLKPGPLTGEEWAVMRKHPEYAYQMLSPIEYLRPALEIPYCHHEKWDGSGYPRRLRGEEIPLSARIFAIVDVWDALISDRPYRPAWTEAAALKYIENQAGIQFDPHVVDVFLKMFSDPTSS